MRPISHILSGKQRRALYPIDVPLGPGSKAALASKDVHIKRELHTLKDGSQHFCQVVTPTNRAPSKILVYIHGYTSSGDMYLEAMCSLARQGAIVVMPDLPGHGRSDGLLCHVPDWWAWIDQVWELMDLVLPPLRASLKKPLRVFASGMSLGGGAVACMAVQRPTYFDGFILVAPMLFVSDAIKPGWLVTQIFKYVLLPLLPEWPMTPTKNMDELDFRVVEHGRRYPKGNFLGMQGLKCRLASAYQFGFVFPAWIESRLKQVRTPFLILHGTADKITDPVMSQRLHDEASSTDKTIKMYDGAYHCDMLCCLPGNAEMIQMDFLPEQSSCTSDCLRDMNAWMDDRL